MLLSDHGESLGEHGEDEHGFFIYNATLHVPLILKLPGGNGSRGYGARGAGSANVTPSDYRTPVPQVIAPPVGAVDVAPTIAQIVRNSRRRNPKLSRALPATSAFVRAEPLRMHPCMQSRTIPAIRLAGTNCAAF